MSKWINYDQKKAKLSPRDQAIREENLAARPYYCDEGIRALAAAVALQAIKDYAAAKKSNMVYTAKDLEEFFETDIFSCISGGIEAKDIDALVEGRMEGNVRAKLPAGINPGLYSV